MFRERIVVTDTACSIPPQEARRAGVALIPLHIMWPDGTQDTDFTMPPENLYPRMQKSGIPTTSGATPPDFIEFYRQLYGQGTREIASVHLTGKKSITVDSARLAAHEMKSEHPDMEIRVIDSQAVSLAQWFLVEEAVEMLGSNRSLDEIEQHVRECIPNISLGVAFGTLDNLIKSGRVGGVQAVAAAVFKILPIVELVEGDLRIGVKVRGGPAKARRELVDNFRRQIDDRKELPARLGVVYTRDKDVGDELAELLVDMGIGIRREEIRGPVEARTVLGVHAGPEAVGMAAFWRRS